MKRVLLCLAIAIVAFTACEETEVGPTYFEIDGQEYSLSVGYIYSWTSDLLGANEISLGDKSSSPLNYLSFTLRSGSTSEIEVGTYIYDYSPNQPFRFDYPKLKSTDNHFMTESTHSWTGNIYVSRKNENYFFEFDLTATNYDDDTVTKITGEFNEVLTEGSIIIK